MAKVPNLLLRQGTYYLRRDIPADLRSAYVPKKAIWQSLHTKNKAEAIKRLHERMAQLDDEFARSRLEQGHVQSPRFAAALGKVGDKLNAFGLIFPQYKFDTADPVEQAFQEMFGYVDPPKSRRGLWSSLKRHWLS